MRITHNKPTIGISESNSVKKVILSKNISYGKIGRKAEHLITQYLNRSGKCHLVNSGTTALYLSLAWLKEQHGIDKVFIPTYTCTAVLNAVLHADLRPIIIDIGHNLNISIENITDFDLKNSAIIITNTFGYPADLSRFTNLNIPIIEDNAQSIGSTYKKTLLGSFGICSTYSFYATKMITCGYGGAIFTTNHQLSDWLDDYLNFDMPREYKPRFNYLLSDINSGILIEQLNNINYFLDKRKQIFTIYKKYFGDLIYESKNSDCEPNYYRILLEVNNPLKISESLKMNGIDTIIPITTSELIHNYLCLNKNMFPSAEIVSTRYLSLPAYPSLTQKNLGEIVGCLTKLLS